MSQIQAIDTSVDLLKALLWQHDRAEALKSLIAAKQAWYETNHTEFWNSWVRDVFDISTANEFGLLVWARILNVPLFVEKPATVGKAAFGFGSNNQNFNNGNFARGAPGVVNLTTEQKRLVIQLRYFQLTTRGAVTEINEFYTTVFEEGAVYVDDNLDMTADYFFTFSPSSAIRFVLENFDLLPRPAGVGLNIQIQVPDSFGFETFHLNFENGGFGA